MRGAGGGGRGPLKISFSGGGSASDPPRTSVLVSIPALPVAAAAPFAAVRLFGGARRVLFFFSALSIAVGAMPFLFPWRRGFAELSFEAGLFRELAALVVARSVRLRIGCRVPRAFEAAAFVTPGVEARTARRRWRTIRTATRGAFAAGSRTVTKPLATFARAARFPEGTFPIGTVSEGSRLPLPGGTLPERTSVLPERTGGTRTARSSCAITAPTWLSSSHHELPPTELRARQAFERMRCGLGALQSDEAKTTRTSIRRHGQCDAFDDASVVLLKERADFVRGRVVGQLPQKHRAIVGPRRALGGRAARRVLSEAAHAHGAPRLDRTVELGSRTIRCIDGRKRHEAKAARTSRIPITRHVDVHDAKARAFENRTEVLLRHRIGEAPYEQLPCVVRTHDFPASLSGHRAGRLRRGFGGTNDTE